MKRADWDFFCLKPKTDCYQKGVFLISLTPNSFHHSSLKHFGKLNSFSGMGDLWYQMVPTDLQRVRITVTAKLYDSGRTITLGTAELTRE